MNRFLFVSLFVSIALIALNSCKKGKNELSPVQTKVEFTFSPEQLKSSESSGLTSVVVSIEDLQGNVIKNTEKVEIYNMNGYYISKPISLAVGEYKLTRFLVLNSSNDVVYASPVVGSDKANLMDESLPIQFSTQKDVVGKLNLKVVSTNSSQPGDFGYATFSFEIADKFDFLLSVFVYDSINKNYELTTADISIYSSSDSIYSGYLNSNIDSGAVFYDSLGITNQITLPEKYESFVLTITKPGYLEYNETFSKEELRLYDEDNNGPLIVVLDADQNYTICSEMARFKVDTILHEWLNNIVTIENLSIEGADSYIFDLGDGDVQIYNTLSSFTHAYNPGVHTIKLDVTKDDCTSSYSTVVCILDCQLPDNTVAFEAYPSFQVWPDNTIGIENLSTEGADSYTFDFGDGSVVTQTSRIPSFSHTYDKPGNYLITLAVTKDSCVSVEQQSISIF
jgi:PKD repeat protein